VDPNELVYVYSGLH